MPLAVARRPWTVSRAAGAFWLGFICLGSASCATNQSAPTTSAVSAAHTNQAPLPPVSDADRDLTADQQVLQALNRLAFGPRPGDVARVRQMGVDRWMRQQLSPNTINDSATDAFVARFPSYGEMVAQLETDYPPGNKVLMDRRAALQGTTATGSAATGAPMTAMPAVNSKPMTSEDSIAVQTAERSAGRLVLDVQTVRVARAVMSERQLQEVMVDFWENHFTVYDRKGQRMRYFLAEFDRDVIRPNALGNFRNLLGAVAKSPAMLFYLDNWESAADSGQPTLVSRPQPRPGAQRPFVAGNPAPAPKRPARGLNENYGRELLELHTLGVDGGYTQQDVIAVARALTGWSIARPQEAVGGGGADQGEFVFRPQWHDAGVKVVLGHTLPAGRGMEDGEDVLDIVAHHPSTAKYLATKLCERFVSDSPPPALVARAAATFTRTNGDIRQVVWTIVSSPEFFSRAAYRRKVKSPFEVVVSALRAVGAEPDATPRTVQTIARMGEPIFGHQAPNGYPETGESWMNTGAILNRINFGLAVAANQIPGASLNQWPDARTLAVLPRAAQVDGVVNDFLGGDVSPDTRAVLLSGDHPLLGANGPYASPATITAGPTVATASDMSARHPPASNQMTDAGSGNNAGNSQPNNRRQLAPTPQLQGLAQVVGLALGAPEFQRR